MSSEKAEIARLNYLELTRKIPHPKPWNKGINHQILVYNELLNTFENDLYKEIKEIRI